MENDLILKKLKSHNRREQLKKIFIVLGILAAICTICLIRLSAESQEAKVYCGYESEHTDACYEERQVLNCSLEEGETHQHSDICYTTEKVLICDKPIHQHTLQCFSDPDADVEDSSVWDVFTAADLSGDIREDITAIAYSQIGYAESERNYLVLDDGISKNGYTRYGDRYGDRYADWSVLFCFFCMDLANAGPEIMPPDDSCSHWIGKLTARDHYEDVSYHPVKGDIVFLTDDHCGIISEVSDGRIRVIEGDRDDQVKLTAYELSDPDILGYGTLVRGSADTGSAEPETAEDVKASEVSAGSEGTEIQEEAEGSKAPERDGTVEAERSAAEETDEPGKDDMSAESSAEKPDEMPIIKSTVPVRLQSAPEHNGSTYYSSDLKDFVRSITIKDHDGNEIGEDGTIYLGERYRIDIDFEEINTAGAEKQFEYDRDGYLTYQFDTDVFSFDSVMSGNILNENNEAMGSYSIDSSGRARVRFFYLDEYNNITETDTGRNIIDAFQTVAFDLFVTATVSAEGSGDRIEIDFGDDVVIHVDVNKGGELYNKKSGSYYHEETRTVDYTIEVGCSHGRVDGLEITDTAELSIDNIVYSDPLDVINMTITDLNGDPVYDENNVRIDSIEGLNALQASLTGGEGYRISYSLKLKDSVTAQHAVSGAMIRNTLSARGMTGEGVERPEPVTVSTQFQLANAAKRGYNCVREINGVETPLICWTVSVGDYVNDQGGRCITDTLGEGLTFCTDIEPTYSAKNPDSSGTLAWNGSGSTGAVIDQNDPSKAYFYLPEHDTRYTITYYTEYSNGDTTYYNTIDYSGYESVSGSAVVKGTGTTIFKEHTAVDSEYVYYKITVHIPAGNAGSYMYIEDWMAANGSPENKPENMRVTLEDVDTGIITDLLPYGSGEGQSDIFGEYYCLYTNDSGSTNRGTFKMTFQKTNSPNGVWPFDEAKILTLTYAIPKSAKNQNGVTITEYLNRSYELKNTAAFSINNREVARDVDSLISVDDIAKFGNTADNSNGVFHYKVNILNCKTTDRTSYEPYLKSSDSDFYITDSFDERLGYVQGSMKATLYSRPSNGSALYYMTQYDLSGADWNRYAEYLYNGMITDAAAGFRAELDDFEFTHQFKKYNNQDIPHDMTLGDMLEQHPEDFAVVVEYDLQVRDEYLDIDHAQQEYALKNNARFGYVDNGENYLSDPASKTLYYTNKILDKTVSDLSEADTLDFEIIANSRGRDLTDGDTIVIEDEMCDALVLYLNTVKVYTGTGTGTNITWTELSDADIRYSGPENRLSATVPDNVPVKLTYTCKVTGNQGEVVNVSNSVSIMGYRECSNTVDKHYTVNGSSGGSGHIGSFEIYILKQDADTLEPLSGAVFALYGPQNDDKMTDPPEGVDRTITAHDETLYYYKSFNTEDHGGALNGSFTVTEAMLASQGHYALVEISAPEGYTADSTICDFYAWERPGTSFDAIPLMEDKNTLTVKNEPEAQGFILNLTKEWADVDTDSRSEVTMYLYEETENSGGSGAVAAPVRDKYGNIVTAVLNAGNGWQGVFEKLDPEKTYYLREIKPDGCCVSYSCGEPEAVIYDGEVIYAVRVDNDEPSVTVINSAGCSLPETGGTGGMMYYASGALLAACALAGLLRRRLRS